MLRSLDCGVMRVCVCARVQTKCSCLKIR